MNIDFKSNIKRILSSILLLVLSGVMLIISVDYKPYNIERVVVCNKSNGQVFRNQKINLLSWNIGYAGLSSNADFFMDGGKNVISDNKDTVMENLSEISNYIQDSHPNLVFLQEVDFKSKRTYLINEYALLSSDLSNYENMFAYNYKSPFVPYPIPPIGRIETGLATYSNIHSTSSTRHSLPNPFVWPVSAFNLKRCILETRIPVEGTDKELALFNVHLEAYDNGKGKIAQTEMLKELITKEHNKGNYIIVGGDFNQTFSNVDMTNYPITANDAWQPGVIDVNDFNEYFSLIMNEDVPSCRALNKPYNPNDENFQYYIIDGFIISNNISIDSFYVDSLGFKNSDHNPLRLTVTLK